MLAVMLADKSLLADHLFIAIIMETAAEQKRLATSKPKQTIQGAVCGASLILESRGSVSVVLILWSWRTFLAYC